MMPFTTALLGLSSFLVRGRYPHSSSDDRSWSRHAVPDRGGKVIQNLAKLLGRTPMTPESVCDYCGEELSEKPVRLGERVFCCDACAFEATRSKDCGGRTDSTFSEAVIEMPEMPKQE